MSNVIATLQHVSKRYHLGQERSNIRAALPGHWGEPATKKTFLALDDVSFEVKAGEAVGLIGPNGAGKSTALKVISGVVSPTSGVVTRPARMVSIIELGLGFDPDLNAIENISYGGAMLGLTERDARSRRDEIIEFAELQEFTEMPVKRYSTGMLARLGFALATSVEADLYVVDEVLSVGDWGFQRRSLEKMRDLHRGGAAMLFVSHNLWVVNQLCDRAVLLDHGRETASGRTHRVIAHYVGETPYLNELPEEVIERSPARVAADADADPEVGLDPDLEGDLGPEEDVLAAAGLAMMRSLHRPAYEFSGVEVTPSECETGDPVTFRGRLDVRHVIPDARLVVGVYWEGFAAFSAPEELPSEILQQPGLHDWEVRYPIFPCPPAVVTFQIAIINGDEPEDPEQLLPNALVRGRADLKVLGEVTGRPGVKLPHSWVAQRVDEVA